MKLANKIENDKVYTLLLLENKEDVYEYFDIYHKDIASTFANDYILDGINDGTENPKKHRFTELVEMKIESSGKPLNIIDVCQISDKILLKKLEGMVDCFDKYNLPYVRINSSGGYCYEKDLGKYFNIRDINKKEMYSYIHYGHIEDKIVINTEYVFIENDTKVNKDFIDLFGGVDKTILYDFRKRISCYTDLEIYQIFDDGVKSGMRNICFESTGQDRSQIEKMVYLLKLLLNSNTDINLSIHIRCYDDNIIEIFKNIKQENFKLYLL